MKVEAFVCTVSERKKRWIFSNYVETAGTNNCHFIYRIHFRTLIRYSLAQPLRIKANLPIWFYKQDIGLFKLPE